MEEPMLRSSVIAQPRAIHVLGACVGLILFVQMIMMCVMLGGISVIAPEIKKVLSDAQVMVPEMHNSLVALGEMLPEIKDGMRILDQLCSEATHCHV